jgi:hypothetical protein
LRGRSRRRLWRLVARGRCGIEPAHILVAGLLGKRTLEARRRISFLFGTVGRALFV